MLYRIEAGLFPHLDDTIGRKTAASIREALGIPVKSVRTIKVFTLEGPFKDFDICALFC